MFCLLHQSRIGIKLTFYLHIKHLDLINIFYHMAHICKAHSILIYAIPYMREGIIYSILYTLTFLILMNFVLFIICENINHSIDRAAYPLRWNQFRWESDRDWVINLTAATWMNESIGNYMFVPSREKTQIAPIFPAAAKCHSSVQQRENTHHALY